MVSGAEWTGFRPLNPIGRTKMTTSDTRFAQPVELTDADMAAVSAGLKTKAGSPIAELIADIKRFDETLLADLGLGKPTRMKA